MYAVIKISGKQWRVEEGYKIKVDKLDVEEGKTLEITDVLLLKKGDNQVEIGTPFIKGCKITAKATKQFKDKKVIVFKKKKRKGYKKKQGHRQQKTLLEIEKIQYE